MRGTSNICPPKEIFLTVWTRLLGVTLCEVGLFIPISWLFFSLLCHSHYIECYFFYTDLFLSKSEIFFIGAISIIFPCRKQKPAYSRIRFSKGGKKKKKKYFDSDSDTIKKVKKRPKVLCHFFNLFKA